MQVSARKASFSLAMSQLPTDSGSDLAVHSAVQYSIVQYSTVQYSTVQYSTVQYSTVQYSC